MTRFKLTLEYDGARFVWQRQENGVSVQKRTRFFAMTGERALVHGGGMRVHATGRAPRATGRPSDSPMGSTRISSRFYAIAWIGPGGSPGSAPIPVLEFEGLTRI